MIIGSGIEKPAFVHGDTALADVQTFGCGNVIAPEHVASARIDGPDPVRHGEVEHTIHNQRRRLDSRFLARLKGPGQREVMHVMRRDLRE